MWSRVTCVNFLLMCATLAHAQPAIDSSPLDGEWHNLNHDYTISIARSSTALEVTIVMADTEPTVVAAILSIAGCFFYFEPTGPYKLGNKVAWCITPNPRYLTSKDLDFRPDRQERT